MDPLVVDNKIDNIDNNNNKDNLIGLDMGDTMGLSGI
jgi:hypothetical protein